MDNTMNLCDVVPMSGSYVPNYSGLGDPHAAAAAAANNPFFLQQAGIPGFPPTTLPAPPTTVWPVAADLNVYVRAKRVQSSAAQEDH
jgi:hypothetical protein